MARGNQTQVTEILLLGFSHGRPFLFLLFLATYLVTLLGNSAILALVLLDPHLHNPMYFFLSHLSWLDICYSTATVPKVLANSLLPRAAISYRGCLAQTFFLMSCAGAECALLAVMAYDRYAAIVHPLHYAHTMPRAACRAMAAGCWLWGALDSAVHTLLASRLSFCRAVHLQHLFCDVPPLLRAACGNTRPSEAALHAASIFVGFGPFLLVLGSYLRILVAVLAVPAAAGRRKAFSTCSAHLLVVTLYFVTANLNYNRLGTDGSPLAGAVVSALFCIVTPALNPLIYSLRNQEVRAALRRVLRWRCGSRGCGADVGLRPQGGGIGGP
ncbi:olfactory receptor 2A12-like [Tympanuchus pallidicinctus]|uniref:olfactory receptor 2A12-like n=1 Tax=Tympanuchus pallidicinctus TaxID=109042 RepID=UPI0022875E2C|nr:olfactory receptor 2A12-like [Tympanuchus pallidicinctus]